jgi:cytochrome P450
MTAAPAPASAIPGNDADPFGHEVLEDPAPFHAALRDAGPVVHLTAYDVYAMGRYAHVRAALTDWQDFQSGAGVGLSNFRYEKPWRPPSLLLEADPPQHDAPRAVLSKILGQRALRRLREQWMADAAGLVDQVLAAGTEFDAVSTLAEAFPLRVFPDAVGIGKDGREHLLPYGDHLFNAFGPPNDLAARGAPRVAELSAWVNARCAREMLTGDGLGARIWARRRPRGHHSRAGAPGRPLPAVRGRRHHRARPGRRPVRLRYQPRRLAAATPRPGAGARRLRRGRPLGIARPDVLPHRHRRHQRRRCRHPGRQEDPHVPRRRQP